MEQDVFMAGVRPGSPGTQTEIKMLLCFILTKIGQPMSFEQLYESLSEDALVNYFDLVAALEQLEQLEHITRSSGEDGADLYAVTPTGRQAGNEFTSALPLSVRERALTAGGKLMARRQRLQEVEVSVANAGDGGYNLRCSIPGEGEELVSFSVYAPNREQCELIRRRFLNAPGFIYKGVLALLTGDREVMDEAFPSSEEQLF